MAVISLDIHVEDLDSVLAIFDKIQVWRSITGELGEYSEITAVASTYAILDGSIEGPWVISSHDLIIYLNNADPITVTFTGTDPLNLADAIRGVNEVIPALATEVPPDTNKLRLISPVLGTGSSIRVEGDAPVDLGLSLVKVNGKAIRISLTSPTTEYNFKDYDGLDNYYYKTRYYNSVTGTVSSFSEPRQGNPEVVIPSSKLSLATISLADVAGRPIVGRRIIFAPIQPYLVPTTEYGQIPGFDRVIMSTDQKGHAEMYLIRNVRMRVFIEGTSYNREFIVPDADNFDVLFVASTDPDPFSIVSKPALPIRVI